MSKSELSKILISSLISILTAIGFLWFTSIRSLVTEDQVMIMIESRSQYSQDKQVISKNIVMTEKLVNDLTKINSILSSLQTLVIAKLDTVITLTTNLDTRVSNVEDRVLFVERNISNYGSKK